MFRYPWGNSEPDCRYADFKFNGTDCRGRGTSKVCETLLGHSVEGICDLGGNLYEWVQDHYNSDAALIPSDGSGACVGTISCVTDSSDQYGRVLRGGSWLEDGSNMRTDVRLYETPSNQDNYFGGRLVR